MGHLQTVSSVHMSLKHMKMGCILVTFQAWEQYNHIFYVVDTVIIMVVGMDLAKLFIANCHQWKQWNDL